MPRTVALICAALLLVAACTGPNPGSGQPPASLDPASPRIAADDLQFDRAELQVPAGEAFVLVFENRESAPHNVAIHTEAGAREARFQGEIFAGPATRSYQVPALEAATYVFVCDLHPSMTGRLVAA
jgi:plastocyanin